MKAAPVTLAVVHSVTARKETERAARSCDTPHARQVPNSGSSLQKPLTSKYFTKQRNPPSTAEAPLSPYPTQPCTSSSGWQVFQTNFHLKPTAEVKFSISPDPLPNPYASSPRLRAWLGSQMRPLERKGKEQNTLTFVSHLSATSVSISDALPAPIAPSLSAPSPRMLGRIRRGAEPPAARCPAPGHRGTQRPSAQPPACLRALPAPAGKHCLRPTGT